MAKTSSEDSRQRHFLYVVGKIAKQEKTHWHNCLYPDCRKKAIRSHSQQKEGQLRAIAEDGLVVAPSRNLYKRLRSNGRGQPDYGFEAIGIDTASTFAGFCPRHDAETFAPIEDRPLAPGDAQQVLLLFLRSACHEFDAKRKASFRFAMLLREFGNEMDPGSREALEAWLSGIDLFLSEDGPRLMRKMWSRLVSPSESDMRFVWIVLAGNLGVSCTTLFNPLMDYWGDLPSHASRLGRQPNVSLSIIPGPDITHTVFAWLPEDEEDAVWLRHNILVGGELEFLINRFVFGDSEDAYYRPSLWQSIPAEARLVISGLLRHEFFRGTTDDYPIILRIGEALESCSN